jgi:hypothetical protein
VGSLLLLAFSTLVVRGQLYTGSLAGLVLDPSNAPVMSARITLIDADRSTRADAKSDSSGRYLFRSLSPGNYSLEVEPPGFELFNFHVSIEVNASLSTEARLQLLARRTTGPRLQQALLASSPSTSNWTIALAPRTR